jgi:hypothetical protein
LSFDTQGGPDSGVGRVSITEHQGVTQEFHFCSVRWTGAAGVPLHHQTLLASGELVNADGPARHARAVVLTTEAEHTYTMETQLLGDALPGTSERKDMIDAEFSDGLPEELVDDPSRRSDRTGHSSRVPREQLKHDHVLVTRSGVAEPAPREGPPSAVEAVHAVLSDPRIPVVRMSVGSGTNVTLAEYWNGTKWAIKKTPNPSGAAESALSAVSCTSATACTAVGSYNSADVALTLAEAWNGTKWAIKKTPNPSGDAAYLDGVSCSSANSCIAVGYYINGADAIVTLAEAWNGTKWAIQSTPNPNLAAGSYLNGVSCTSATACTAVGDSYNSVYAGVTLAEVG